MARARSPTLLVVCSLALLASGGWLLSKARFVMRARPFVGRVVEIYPCGLAGGPRGSHTPSSCAKVRYSAPGGSTGTMTVSKVYPGTGTVNLLYDPEDPSKVEVDDSRGLWWLGPVWLTLFCLYASLRAAYQFAFSARGAEKA